MEINGEISRVIYFNEDNGYTVASFILSLKCFEECTSFTSSRSITICGSFDRKPVESDELTLTGEFKTNLKYGMQFSFTSFKRAELKNEEAIIRYLSSDIFPGIGRGTATKVVNKLGLDAIEEISKNEVSLEGIGLTRKQIEIIKDGVIKDKANQEALLYYLDGGLSIDVASKIINTLGVNNLSLVKENPYIIMDMVSYVGFSKNDSFALKKGIKKDSLFRLSALTLHLLKNSIFNNGNSYVTYQELLSLVSSYLEKDNENLDVNKFEHVLNKLNEDKKIYLLFSEDENDRLIFDYNLYYQEKASARIISNLIKGKRGNTVKFSDNEIDNQFNNIKENKDFVFSDKQVLAIKEALKNDIMIITGGPGTGKTTIIKTVLEMYLNLTHKIDDIAVLAPTGRAAKRINETSGFTSSTIHRYLGYDGVHFAFSKDEQRSEKLVIVDESSMMDLSLFYQLISSISNDARLIIVGDVDQLPSIGPGQILKDLISCKEIKTIYLDQIHRQSENSSIISLARSINQGLLPNDLLEKKSDRSVICTNNESLLKNILDIVSISIQKGYDIQKDLQILIPMYKTDLGIDHVNHLIQDLVNPKTNKKYQEFTYLGRAFRVNDKIIQLINEPEKGIMNGDIGYITSFNVENEKIIGLSARFDDENVDYTIDEMDQISLAYAVTIHKSQGSEFKVVIMPISSFYYPMLKRKLIYTGITRAKEKLIILGDVNMLKFAAGRIESNRKTILTKEIKKNLGSNLDEVEDFKKPFVYNVPLYKEEEQDDEEITSIGETEVNLEDNDF